MLTCLCDCVYKKFGSLGTCILSEVFCWNMSNCKILLRFYLNTGNLLMGIIMELLQLTVVNTVQHAVLLRRLTHKKYDKWKPNIV